MRHGRHLAPILMAGGVALPGIFVRLGHIELAAPAAAIVSGVAILGAAFLLLWACDAAQTDISQSLALAVVALIAVLPEYAVDMYFTWQAGAHPEGDYAQYAIANMTGANRLLIGLGWAAIVVIFWIKTRRAVEIEEDRRTELLFLALATLYAFVVVAKGTLAWYDTIVFVGMYVLYIRIASRRPPTEFEAEGPAELLCSLPKRRRRLATVAMFLFAGGAILANAEPFCEGLITTGAQLGIDQFLLVQWLAPIASEAPEFIVALMFVLRGHASMALGSLVSAKLNQWTLLVGMIPGVYAVSLGSLEHPIPMGALQMHEILLTAAQSLLAVVMLMSLRLTLWQALLLFVLFLGQLLCGVMPQALAAVGLSHLDADQVHQLFSLIYISGAVVLIAERPSRLRDLWRGAWQ